MTLKELIAELTELAEEWGENTEVTSRHGEPDDHPAPIVSVGPREGGGPFVVTIC